MSSGESLLPCAQHAQKSQLDPIGSAGTYEDYFLLETPLPWAHDPWQSKSIPEELGAFFQSLGQSGRPQRCMAIAPEDEDIKPGFKNFIWYERSQESPHKYTRKHYLVPDESLTESIKSIVEMDSKCPHQPLETLEEVREFFVCTHGSRDQCCGKHGYPIYKALKENGHRVWRISHTGGHRFAPTCIDFPTGHYWAWLTPDLALQIGEKSVAPGTLKNHYRGWSGVPKHEQIIERALFLREGWPSWEQHRYIKQQKQDGLFTIYVGDKSFEVLTRPTEIIRARAKCSSEELKTYQQHKVDTMVDLSNVP